MTVTQQPATRKPRALPARLRSLLHLPAPLALREFAILICVTLFLFCYGLTPFTGGDRLGLVGADEPRYAQIAPRDAHRA